eukprot:TRINITY_DN17723_c0_g1_i1.p1 TRINITY_DN17723_c0_g1~~TRINITY_DN17723_c0_g1_i1.p1  ORF type:complete len:193 (-),score=19.25 TRINITY_DN17723_c0_g1_i1:29-607(-)
MGSYRPYSDPQLLALDADEPIAVTFRSTLEKASTFELLFSEGTDVYSALYPDDTLPSVCFSMKGKVAPVPISKAQIQDISLFERNLSEFHKNMGKSRHFFVCFSMILMLIGLVCLYSTTITCSVLGYDHVIEKLPSLSSFSLFALLAISLRLSFLYLKEDKLMYGANRVLSAYHVTFKTASGQLFIHRDEIE